MDEVPRAFAISDIQSSPVGYERSSVCQLSQKQMNRWMCGISLKDRRTNEELRTLVGVEPITTFIRSGRLRWY